MKKPAHDPLAPGWQGSLDRARIRKYSRFYGALRLFAGPVIRAVFRPLVAHPENLSASKSAIIAPNHLKTADSIVLFGQLPHYIRWAALKRFFDAEDSIFGNSKNLILRHFTAWMFRRMGMLPIDRETDNWSTFLEMYSSLRSGLWIGFFPEGTTNKKPQDVIVQEPKKSVFVIAKDTGALVQPIALTWVSKEDRVALRIRHRIAVNIR